MPALKISAKCKRYVLNEFEMSCLAEVDPETIYITTVDSRYLEVKGTL